MPLLWNVFWTAAAANPLDWTGPLAGRFAVAQWGVADGLPQSSVTDLAQSPDGYLYASTFGGLARFDGVRFLVSDPTRSPGLPSIRFTAVATDVNGRVWVGLQNGEVAELRGDDVIVLPDPEGPAIGAVRALLPIGDDLWVATRQSLVQFHDGRWTRYEWPANAVVGTADTIWAGGNRGLARIDGQVLTPVPIQLPNPIGGLVQSADGQQLWIATEAGVEVRLADGTSRVVYRGTNEHPILAGASPAIGPDGRVWIGSNVGLDLLGTTTDLLAAPEPLRAPLAHLTTTDAVRAVRFDREGHLWLGTDLDGLLRVSPLPFDRYLPALAAHPSVQAVDATADPVLVAPVCSGLWSWSTDLGFTAIPAGGAHGCVVAIRRLRGGGAVYGSGTELYRLGDPSEPLATFPDQVLALTEQQDGTLWVGTDGSGAWTVRNGVVAQVPETATGHVMAIVEAPDGSMWLANGPAVTVIAPSGAVDQLDTEDGLSSVQIRALLVDGDGVGWIGTYGGGLMRVAGGRAVVYTEATGLAENVVSSIVDDGRGFLWLNGNRGVCRVPRTDLEAVAAGRITTVRGLLFPTGEGNGGMWPSATTDPTGRLWFATTRGAVAFDPDAVSWNEVPPVPIIEEISVDGVGYPVGGKWEAPVGPRELSIRYTAAVLGEPQLARFQYRLLPIEKEWRQAEDRRLVHYAQLAPDIYTFEVRAANEDGVWSTTPARARVMLRPALSETGLFRLGVGAATLALVLGAFQVRTVAQRSRNAALQAEIDRRKQVEAALRTSEAHYRSVFEAASDGLLVVDPDGVVQDANAAARRLFGRPEDDLRGKRRGTLVAGDAEDRGISADGTSFPARISTVALGDGRELTSVVDLGPLVALQDRLANAQRLEAIGRLAGGVAHDFNNLLTVVRANAVSLRSSMRNVATDPGPMLESIDHIEVVAQRGSDLTRQLLAFGQRQLLRPELVDVSALALRMEAMLRRLVRDDVVLGVHAPEPCVVRADPTQTELALVNLVLNAIDAVPGAGRIEITVKRVADRDAQQAWPTIRPGVDWVVLTVADTGVGIRSDVLPHVFEPFFTTKGGQGNGLGLASVHGFVTQSQGYVFVRSVRAEGTVFDVVLPVGVGQPNTRQLLSVPPRDPNLGASILICDDDPLVRRTIERLLRSGGYQVRGADDAETALILLRESPPDLLVTDVLMPVVTGIELAARAREVQPGLHVVFVSGYTSEVLPTELDGPLVSKPFEPAAFLDVIRRTLK